MPKQKKNKKIDNVLAFSWIAARFITVVVLV